MVYVCDCAKISVFGCILCYCCCVYCDDKCDGVFVVEMAFPSLWLRPLELFTDDARETGRLAELWLLSNSLSEPEPAAECESSETDGGSVLDKTPATAGCLWPAVVVGSSSEIAS